MKVAASARGRGNSVLRCRLVLDHLELVPVGIGEPEDRAPIFLLRRLRDLDALLAESGLFLRGVGRGEHVSRVALLGSGVRAQMEVDVRASRRDRDPVRERRRHAEPELVLPELRGPLLIPYDDRHRLELEHGRGNSGGPDKLAWAAAMPKPLRWFTTSRPLR